MMQLCTQIVHTNKKGLYILPKRIIHLVIIKSDCKLITLLAHIAILEKNDSSVKIHDL